MVIGRFLLAMIDGGGTLPPALGVAAGLVRRGHEVRVLADPTVEAAARSAGCVFTSWRAAPHFDSLAEQTKLIAAMVGQLQARDPAAAVGVSVGDFASSTVGEQFTLVYLLRNTITNLTSQEEQVAAFQNAARHLHPGGHFVIENYVPELQRLPPGETRHVFAATPTHLGFEEYDVANQIAISHHYWVIDDQLQRFSSPHRYVWPAELDLMALMAGLTLRKRWASWTREPFTGESRSHISVWEKAG